MNTQGVRPGAGYSGAARRNDRLNIVAIPRDRLVSGRAVIGAIGGHFADFFFDLIVRSNSSKSSGLKSRLGSCPYAPVA